MCSLQTGKYPIEFYWYAAIYLYQHSFHALELQYQTETRGNAFKVIFPALLRSSLSAHSLSIIIFRLCTGHCHLNHHMSRIGLYPDWLCDQCEMPETVEHVIEVLVPNSQRRDDVWNTQSKILAFIFPPQKSSVAQLLRRMWKLLCESQAYVYRFSLLLPTYIVYRFSLLLQDLAVIQCHPPS